MGLKTRFILFILSFVQVRFIVTKVKANMLKERLKLAFIQDTIVPNFKKINTFGCNCYIEEFITTKSKPLSVSSELASGECIYLLDGRFLGNIELLPHPLGGHRHQVMPLLGCQLVRVFIRVHMPRCLHIWIQPTHWTVNEDFKLIYFYTFNL